MTKISYRIRSKKETANILIRLYIDPNNRPETKTGLIVNTKEWNNDFEKISDKTVNNKNLKTQLLDLKSFLLKEYNLDFEKGTLLNKDWLESKINFYFNRKDEKIDLNFLINYLNEFIENRKLDTSFKVTTNQKFETLKTKIISFQSKNKTIYLLSNFDNKLFNKFRSFLINDCNLMESTTNRTLKNLKTVLRDARYNGYTISHQVDNIKTEIKSEVKIYLSLDEIEQIKNKHLVGSNIAIAKDWLIIGCFVGQRIGDLMRMNKSMITIKKDINGKEYQFIELTQEKTNQYVTIPLHPEVKKILKKHKGNFPPLFSKNPGGNATLFNKHIKEVAGICDINILIKGKVYNEELKRNEIVETEKFNLVSSHICRRSFATNFYSDKRFPTPLLMAITGHKTERVFLEYIGKTSSDFAMNTAQVFEDIENQQIKNKL